MLKNLSANCNLIIQTAEKGNSIVLVENDVYNTHIWKILDDAMKFEKVHIKKFFIFHLTMKDVKKQLFEETWEIR